MGIETFTIVTPSLTITGADDLIEMSVASSSPIEIVRIWASTSSQTIGTQQERLQLQELSGTGTGGGGPRAAVNHSTSGSGSNTTIAYQVPNASQGTANGNPVLDQMFDVTTGFLWISSPSEKIYVPVSGIMALRFPALTNSGNAWVAGITYIEYQ